MKAGSSLQPLTAPQEIDRVRRHLMFAAGAFCVIAFLPGGDILVTEPPGRLRTIRNGKLLPDPVAGVPWCWRKGRSRSASPG